MAGSRLGDARGLELLDPMDSFSLSGQGAFRFLSLSVVRGICGIGRLDVGAIGRLKSVIASCMMFCTTLRFRL